MKKVPMTADQAKNILGTNKEVDATIMATFSKAELGLTKTTDLATSLEAVLEMTGETMEAFKARTQFDDEYERTLKELAVFCKALNPPGWKADYCDGNQRKYFPLHEFNSSGFSFSYYGWTFTGSNARVGSRLLLATSELAEFLGKTQLDRYKIIYS